MTNPLQALPDLQDLRQRIDTIDTQLSTLISERMRIANEVAQTKQKNNIAITDNNREEQVIQNCISAADPSVRDEIILVMRLLMALSKKRQRSLLLQNDPLPSLLPAAAPAKAAPRCVFQGTAGAWSEQALRRLYPEAVSATPVPYFENVFAAVKENAADYGVLPIENSQSGAIGEVYDLLKTYNCYIVGQTWVDIRHCLMAKEGVLLTDIREVLSHPEGFRQCHRYLENYGWDLTACSNTAVAAQTVSQAQGDRRDVAAIGSPRAAELYGLTVLSDEIVDQATNRTRFVAIAKQPAYDESSNTISITFSTAHRSGALCEALMPLLSAGMNMTRIESRPTYGGNYRFFADISGHIQDPETAAVLAVMAASTSYFEVLGCYKE